MEDITTNVRIFFCIVVVCSKLTGMVVDYKLYSKGRSLAPNTFVVGEQIPGFYVRDYLFLKVLLLLLLFFPSFLLFFL
jgi:hypothetical protein